MTKKYHAVYMIRVEETYEQTVEIEANSEEEAKRLAESEYGCSLSEADLIDNTVAEVALIGFREV